MKQTMKAYQNLRLIRQKFNTSSLTYLQCFQYSPANKKAPLRPYHEDPLHLVLPPLSQLGYLKYTKPREFQTQAGQLSSIMPSMAEHTFHHGTQDVTPSELQHCLEQRKSELGGRELIATLDASQDDIGARANFGRGNIAQSETAYDQFLMKVANFQVNRHNIKALESCMIVGSLDIHDVVEQCEGKDPSKEDQRQVLKYGVMIEYERAKKIVKTIFDAKAKLFYINGDHNNMANIVSGFYESRKVLPVIINFDLHSDARLREDGPHSGSWLSEVYYRKECIASYIVGLNLLSNNDVAIENLEKFNVTYRPYTWEQIQLKGGARVAIPQITREIIDDIKKLYEKDQPVILTIDGDTVAGLPSSAQSFNVGYPADEVYTMMSLFIKELNVECLNIAELKPSLDKYMNMACGEFLSHSMFLQAYTELTKTMKNN